MNGTYNYTNGYKSTLLIPEDVVWMPYAGVVMLVIFWLGYDFFMFHRKNKAKYARMRDFMSVQTTTPQHHRISMISGIGLHFRHGKPVLGDVWNTSPSSSSISSGAPLRASREITPSDEEGDNWDNDVTRKNMDGVPSLGMVKTPDGSSAQVMTGDRNMSFEDGSQQSYGFALEPNPRYNEGHSRQSEGHSRQGEGHSRHSSADGSSRQRDNNSGSTLATVHREELSRSLTVLPNHLRDASTQTPALTPEILSLMTQLLYTEDIRSPSPEIVQHPNSLTHRRHREHSGGSNSSSSRVHAGGPQQTPQISQNIPSAPPSSPSPSPVPIIDFGRSGSHQRSERSGDSNSNPSTPRYGRSGSHHHHHHHHHNHHHHKDRDRQQQKQEQQDPIHPQYTHHSKSSDDKSIKLDMASTARSHRPGSGGGSHSARDYDSGHAYSSSSHAQSGVTDVETPLFPGSRESHSSRGNSTSSELFKTPDQYSSRSPAFMRSQSTNSSSSPSHHSSAAASSSNPNYPPPRYSEVRREDSIPKRPHTSRPPRTDSAPSNMASSGSSTARPASTSRRTTSQSPRSTPPKTSSRSGSGSPRTHKDRDREKHRRSDEKPSTKSSSGDASRSEDIPQHLYHQDEEGFFSSVFSLNPSRMFQSSDGDGNSKKGILFFSRLSGAGRRDGNQSNHGRSGQGRHGSGSYRTGGFES